jgi:hypothetical protein
MAVLPGREPCGLREWLPVDQPLGGRLFTCSRPGRTRGSKKPLVEDSVVRDWVSGLSALGDIVIVSLLGRKPAPDGRSEFSYYSFRSAHEDVPGRPTFQEWLDRATSPGRFVVVEHPTTDTKTIPPDVMTAITGSVLAHLRSSRTVVVVDSGGVSRTSSVVRSIGATLHCRFHDTPITTNCR